MWKGLKFVRVIQIISHYLLGEVDEKEEAKCTTVHEPLTGNVWSDHIKVITYGRIT